MKTCLIATILLASTLSAQAADVAVSVQIGQPGFYGRIDIGNAPAPQVIYRQPVVIVREKQVMEPLYLRVPPGHARKWSKHCHRYHACNRPVYFVHENWYKKNYEEPYQREHGHHDKHDHDKGHGKHDKGHDKKGHGHDKKGHGHD